MKTDFYSGFEGYPEMIFESKKDGHVRASVRLWVGYFHDLIERVEPVDGEWRSLALVYNTCEGWLDESPWRCMDVDAALEQWSTIDLEGLSAETVQVHEAIRRVMRDAIDAGGQLWIYDE